MNEQVSPVLSVARKFSTKKILSLSPLQCKDNFFMTMAMQTW
jgi:hypothetical protein